MDKGWYISEQTRLRGEVLAESIKVHKVLDQRDAITQRSRELLYRVVVSESKYRSLLEALCEKYPAEAEKISQINQGIVDAHDNSPEYQKAIREYVERRFEDGLLVPPELKTFAFQKKSQERENS